MKRALIFLMAVPGILFGATDTVKVPEKDARQAIVSKQEPAFPDVARQLKLSGQATIEVVIDTTGKVEQCDPVVGNPIFTSAAIKAVKTWTFKPFNAGGKATKAVTHLTFDFSN